jgi:hypothetical protein
VLPDRDADLAVHRRPGDLLQRQGVMAGVGERVNHRSVITGKTVLQDDQQAIEPAGEVLAEAGVHGHPSGQAGTGPGAALRVTRPRGHVQAC